MIKKTFINTSARYVLIITLFFQFCVLNARTDGDGDNSTSSAQIKYDEKLLATIKPAAPTAASLGKYGDHPVTMTNGLVPISLNLYTIKSGSLSVPIILSNHGGGIKVKEDASWVGLGWSLDFGGSIVRTMQGYPDEHETGTVPVESEMWDDIRHYDTLSTAEQSNFVQKCLLIQNSQRKDMSYKPDLYSYNFGGYSGSCYMNDSVYSIDYTPIKGCRDVEGNLSDFTLPNGDVYRFYSSETTTVASGYKALKSTPYVSTYYVRDITSANGNDKIEYRYQSSGLYENSQNSSYEGQTISEQYDFQVGPGDNETKSKQTTKIVPTKYLPYTLQVNTVKPQYIYFKGGRIVFHLSDRTDMKSSLKKLDRIEIDSLSNGDYEPYKYILFDYSYSNDKLCLDSVREFAAGKFQNIASFEYYGKEYGFPKRDSYSCDYWGYYNGKNNATEIPLAYVEGNCYGGANKTPDEEYLKYGSLKRIAYPTGGYSEFDWEINRVNANQPLYVNLDETHKNELISFSPSYITCGVISKDFVPTLDGDFDVIKSSSTGKLINKHNDYERNFIYVYSYVSQTVNVTYTMKRKSTSNTHYKYDFCRIKINDALKVNLGKDSVLTGTFSVNLQKNSETVFSIEANCENVYGELSFTYNSTDPEKDMHNYPFTGLRIKEIKQCDNDGTVLSRKHYEYVDSLGNSTGYLTGRTDELTNVEKSTSISQNSFVLNVEHNTLVHSGIQKGPSDGDVAYSFVKETVTNGEDTDTLSYSTSEFQKMRDLVNGDAPVISMSKYRNNLLHKKVYGRENGKLELVSETDYYYSKDCRVMFPNTGFILQGSCKFDNYVALLNYKTMESLYLTQLFTPINYSYTSDWQHVDSTKVKTRTTDGRYQTIKTEYTYGSDVHLQPTEVTTGNGLQSATVRYTFSSDYSGGIYDTMKSRNILTYPVEEKHYLTEDSITTFIGEICNKYTLSDNMVQLSDVYRYLPNLTKEHLYKYSYNSCGNLQEYVGKDGVVTSIYWDSQQCHPLVMAVNMPYAKLAEAISMAPNISQLYKLSECKNALITVYSYQPLFGVNCIIQPNGLAAYYNYDGFGRLKTERDTNLRLLKEYEYNFKK